MNKLSIFFINLQSFLSYICRMCSCTIIATATFPRMLSLNHQPSSPLSKTNGGKRLEEGGCLRQILMHWCWEIDKSIDIFSQNNLPSNFRLWTLDWCPQFLWVQYSWKSAVKSAPSYHPIVKTPIQSVGGLVMTKWCSLLQLMVPMVVWLCEETERAVRARKYHKSIATTLVLVPLKLQEVWFQESLRLFKQEGKWF